MKKLMQAMMIALCLCAGAYAQDFVYNGVKPALIIDVRTPGEFAAGHVEGAVNIPYEQISTGITSVKGLGKDSPILVYCQSGRRSAIAKDALDRLGFRSVHDGGGMSTLVRTLRVCTPQIC